MVEKNQKGDISVTLDEDGKKTTMPYEKYSASQAEREVNRDFHLAVPKIREGLAALKGPDYPLLKSDVVKASNPNAKIIYDVSDPEGDDKGDGNYRYPTNPNFREGILDITHFTVSADEKNVYFKLTFRALNDPGWHPEYGFQLTFAAIAIDRGQRGGGVTDIGGNSRYKVTREGMFDRIIYVGGGLRIVGRTRFNSVLCEYLPVAEDVKNPLGSVATKTIDFAVPKEYLGEPSAAWKFLVLVGAQDDHGGAGIGEFRTVEEKGGEWIGGGKKKPELPNVYDVLPAK
jgi:carbohydrate-binding DOMON domain-containing protein